MHSCHCIKSEVSLFDKQPVQNVITRGRNVRYFPINSVSQTTHTPITFVVNCNENEMIDLNDTILEIQGKIKNRDGSKHDSKVDADVFPSKNLLHSIFNDVKIEVGEKVIEGGDTLYHWKAYLNLLLSKNKSYKKCQLDVSGWNAKKEDIQDSKQVQLIGALQSDFLQNGKYLLNNISMRITLNRNSQNLVVKTTKANTNYSFVIERAILYVRTCDINPSVLLGHKKGLESGPALYPIQRCKMSTFNVPANVNQYTVDNVYSGLSPKLIALCMVTNENFTGSDTEEHFNLQHFNIKMINLYVNNDLISTYDLDFGTTSKNKLSYLEMFRGLQMLNEDDNNNISYDEWVKHPIFIFNLCPDLNFDGEHGQVKERPNIRFEFYFDKTLTKAINIIALAFTDGMITINKNRMVQMEE